MFSKKMQLGLAGLIAFGSFQASADLLAEYTFDDGLGGPTLAANFADPGILASDVELNDFSLLGNTGDFDVIEGTASTGGSLDLTSESFVSFTLDGGLDLVSISEVNFEWTLSSTPALEFDVYLLSSATGFAVDQVIGTAGTLGTASTATNPPDDFNGFTLDVSVDTSSIADLQEISGPVEFRLYVTDSLFAPGPLHRIDDISVEGVVVPEPGSLALLGLGGTCLLWRRRSTRQ